MQDVTKTDQTAEAGAPVAVYRRASDPALRRAAEVVRRSFVQIAERQNVADGDVIKALAEALAAVELALPPDASSTKR
jgi:hypothetical protein